MPILPDHFYKVTAIPKTKQYIETGCYRGDGLAKVIDHYEQVHSIELSETWYGHCVNRFKNYPNVHIHFGNSKYVLPEILSKIKEPVTIYLDAHFCAGETAFGEENINGFSSSPLLTELDIIHEHPYNDIIIIDDCRMLGKRGCSNVDANNDLWPSYEYDWTAITEDAIRARMKNAYEIFKNNSRKNYTNGPFDRWVLAIPK